LYDTGQDTERVYSDNPGACTGHMSYQYSCVFQWSLAGSEHLPNTMDSRTHLSCYSSYLYDPYSYRPLSFTDGGL